MAKISNNDIARAIYLSSKDKTMHELVGHNKNILNFLHRKHLLTKSKDILKKLEEIINKDEGRAVVKLNTRTKLKDSTKDHLSAYLKERYKVKEIIMNEEEDESLLGGFKIEIEDEIIDLSVKNKINRLQEHLIGAQSGQAK